MPGDKSKKLSPQFTTGSHSVRTSHPLYWFLILVTIYYFLFFFPYNFITPSSLNLRIFKTSIPPSPPKPEPIDVTELALPPVSPNNEPGSCSDDINPHRTGCMAKNGQFQGGSFMPGGEHVIATVEFSGAPKSPDPANIFSGTQVIIVKINGTFPNGDHWKCITCGIPKANKIGAHDDLGYVQAFRDGKRLLAGRNIILCDFDLLSDDCTPERTHILPIFWNTSSNGNEVDGAMRELRLHPDQDHIAWNSFVIQPPQIMQFGYIGRLNYSPPNSIRSHPRYEVSNVFLLADSSAKSWLEVSGSEIKKNADAIVIGEIRGFSGSGQEITYLGAPVESGNADVFAVNLVTGKVRRLTSHPEYVDPVDISPDDKWTVVMDTRGSNRQMFLSAMRGIPPLTDLITFAAICSVRNNGQRRFFQPYLIDRYGDRESYAGQKLNEKGSGIPGSGAINDPEWNGSADPKWSPHGNRIVYAQRLTVSPACGGKNPLPCYNSTAPGGRTSRLMLATLTSRKPYPPPLVVSFDGNVPWAIKYIPGSPPPHRYNIPPGQYVMNGRVTGNALVTIMENVVYAGYTRFSDDGVTFLDGAEKVTRSTVENNVIDWRSDLVQTGAMSGTKKTSSEGFLFSIDVYQNIFEANGTLVTTIDGVSYHQPANEA